MFIINLKKDIKIMLISDIGANQFCLARSRWILLPAPNSLPLEIKNFDDIFIKLDKVSNTDQGWAQSVICKRILHVNFVCNLFIYDPI